MVLHQRFGLWLAKVSLMLTGNGSYADIVPSLPLIVSRRVLLASCAADESPSENLRSGRWLVWSPGRLSR